MRPPAAPVRQYPYRVPGTLVRQQAGSCQAALLAAPAAGTRTK